MNPSSSTPEGDFLAWPRDLLKKLYKNSRNAAYLALVTGGFGLIYLLFQLLRYFFGNSLLEIVSDIQSLPDQFQYFEFAEVYAYLLAPIDFILGVFLLRTAARMKQALLPQENEAAHVFEALKNINRVFITIYAQYILLIVLIWVAVIAGGRWIS